ncbi:MAG: glycosyltransferase family 1 protein [Bacteroidales bacterium]|nr:MAG: glycosyltransferase family 1 protein [Bacteroidales bacterium]
MESTDKGKNVVIDLTNYGNINVGFGQIAANYAKRFAESNHDDFQLTYLVPEKCDVDFGSDIKILKKKPLYRFIPSLLPKTDVWHAVNQQRKIFPAKGNGKVIFTIHDLNFLVEKKPAKAARYLHRMQKHVDRASVVTAISQYTADIVKQNVDLKGKEIRVIYNGVERIDHIEGSKPAFATGRPFFFTIGQIRRKKNFHLLLDVMKEFPEYDLYICGDTSCNHGVYAEELRSLIDSKNLTNVFLPGTITQDEKVWLYRNCEALLFPSQGEGFGIPPIEAMQFGKAVFAAARTSLPEICGGYGFLWEKLTTEEMVDSIKKHLPGFYDDRERVEKIKQYAFSFSYENHINAYLDIYRELL